MQRKISVNSFPFKLNTWFYCIQGLSIDFRKIQLVFDWPIPKNQIDLREFVGLVSFYWRFIKSFSNINCKLIKLLKNNSEITWTLTCEDNFNILKEAFTLTLVLKLMDYDKEDLALCKYANKVARSYCSLWIKKIKFNQTQLPCLWEKVISYCLCFESLETLPFRQTF
jgi:hypothetical protein